MFGEQVIYWWLYKLLDTERSLESYNQETLCLWLNKSVLYMNFNHYPLKIWNKGERSFKENSSEKGRTEGE